MWMHVVPLQRVTSLCRRAQANAPAASYWLRRFLDDGGHRDYKKFSPTNGCQVTRKKTAYYAYRFTSVHDRNQRLDSIPCRRMLPLLFVIYATLIFPAARLLQA